jgi:hypothetical protein
MKWSVLHSINFLQKVCKLFPIKFTNFTWMYHYLYCTFYWSRVSYKRRINTFCLSFYTAIFKPTSLLEPVFQPAKFGSWIRNREDAIRRSEKCRTICFVIRFLWNIIQLYFRFQIKFTTPYFYSTHYKLQLII